MSEQRRQGDLRRRAWRWHFIAALLVIPYVLWQSVTGTLYVWSEWWVDQAHTDLRFVTPAAQTAPLDGQIAAARAVQPQRPLARIQRPADPRRSTQVMFSDDLGLPLAVFVDPYRGTVLGTLQGSAWPVGWSRSLHGGWPFGTFGSWLLEIGTCWTFVMVLTGLYLWWPRDGRGLWALVPRLRAGRWVFWRDLHACVAVWFSLLIVLFLLTAMPWTSFWGSNVLGPVQRALNQQSPRATAFAPVFASSGEPGQTSLQDMLALARRRGLEGDLMFHMVDGPPGSAVSVRELEPRSSEEKYLLLDRRNGAIVDQADWNDFSLMTKMIYTGVDLHEASYFGRVGPWINTTFALALIWLCVTGFMAWWRRKPAAAIGVPPPPRQPWPWWLRGVALVMFLLLPLLALSALLLWIVEWTVARVSARRAVA